MSYTTTNATGPQQPGGIACIRPNGGADVMLEGLAFSHDAIRDPADGSFLLLLSWWRPPAMP